MNFDVTQNSHESINVTLNCSTASEIQSNYPKTFTTAQNCLKYLTATTIAQQQKNPDISTNILTIAATETTKSIVFGESVLTTSDVCSTATTPLDSPSPQTSLQKQIVHSLRPMKTSLPGESEVDKFNNTYNENLNSDIHRNIPAHLNNAVNVTIIDNELTIPKTIRSESVILHCITSDNDRKDNLKNTLEYNKKTFFGEEAKTTENNKYHEDEELVTKKWGFQISQPIANIAQLSTSNISTEEDEIFHAADIDDPIIESIYNNCNGSERAHTELNAITSDRGKIIALSERVKKTSWYNVFYPNYKSRSQDFKKLFKELPIDERLIVDYSCALFKDLLLQGRLYVSQNYVCFHANILGWETHLIIKWEDVTAVTKEKTALVIPNAISIATAKENHFFSSFTTRDKTYLILFRIWQNTLMNKLMMPQELWQLVHNYYGDELGLTTDDEDYVDPTKIKINDLCENNLDYVSALNDITTTTSSTYFSTVDIPNTFTSTSITVKPKLCISISTTENSSSNSKYSTTSTSCISSNIKIMKSTTKDVPIIGSIHNSGGSCDSGRDGHSKETKYGLHLYESGKRKFFKHIRHRDDSFCTNLEAIPTDMSDSSDSEENNIPFVATAECNSPHEGRQLVHTILPINIETLFNLLFAKSKFLVDFHTLRKSTDMTFGEWIINDDGQKNRTVNVTVQLSASVGPKTSKVTEYQVMRDCSKPGELYSIDINSVNAGIPYADSFTVLMHYCLVKTVDDHTMLSVHAQIKYKKSIWGVVKGFIEKNTWAGLEDFYTALLHSLQNETNIPPAKGKGRRPRRGNVTAQSRPLEEKPILQIKTDAPEQFHSSHTLAAHLTTDVPLAIITDAPNKYKKLSIFVLILLCFLIAVNIVLLLKLWRLEDRIKNDIENRSRLPNFSIFKKLPSTDEDWLELMREQEILHETELKKWHNVLQTAIDLLKKTEKALVDLMLR